MSWQERNCLSTDNFLYRLYLRSCKVGGYDLTSGSFSCDSALALRSLWPRVTTVMEEWDGKLPCNNPRQNKTQSRQNQDEMKTNLFLVRGLICRLVILWIQKFWWRPDSNTCKLCRWTSSTIYRKTMRGGTGGAKRCGLRGRQVMKAKTNLERVWKSLFGIGNPYKKSGEITSHLWWQRSPASKICWWKKQRHFVLKC